MNKEEIKQSIWQYEYNRNGLKHQNGADVLVLNLKILKEKVKCDIKIYNLDGSHMERFNDCEYDMEMFKNDK